MSDPIGNQAMLASLSFHLPRQAKQLPKEAKKVEEENHAQHGVAKVSIHFFQQQDGKTTIDALSDLKAHFGFWKREHTRLTIPWMNDARLLAAAILPTYLNMRSAMEEATPEKVEEFMSVYPDWEVTAPTRMGALFNAEEFPSATECRERITWESTLMPLPEADSFKRIALINPQQAAAEETRLNEAVNRARESARLQTWQELIGHIDHIVKTLSSDKPRIFETLIGGLNSMLTMVPAYSPLFNDAELTRCAAEAQATLAGINVEDLRTDPSLRASTVTAARDLLARFGALGARRFA